jgi:DNA-directed RNA polymerase subunit RPC12/RpoP
MVVWDDDRGYYEMLLDETEADEDEEDDNWYYCLNCGARFYLDLDDLDDQYLITLYNEGIVCPICRNEFFYEDEFFAS